MVFKKRSLEDCNSLVIKIGIDGRSCFLKFCMSIFDIDNLVSKNETSLSKKSKDLGVKKVFLIAVVLDIPENYVEVRKQIMSSCFEFNITATYRVETVLKTMFELITS